MKRVLKPLAMTVALLVSIVVDGRGQSALDGFNPIVGDFVIVTVVQPDGRILLGGQFNGANSIGGQTRNYIARLNPDGTLDTGFDPNANSQVYSIAVQANGKILVGGNFTFIGGQTRNHIARLDPTTGLADSFDPNASSNIYSMAVQADGKILVGGSFAGPNSIGGQTRNRIARLDPATGLADAFDPNANSSVQYNSIVVQADGTILVGGDFTFIGGQTRNYIARLDPTTGLADSFNPNANNSVDTIAVQANGKILAGGGFTSIGGQTRNYIARLDPTTGLADSFDPNASLPVGFVAVQADGKILAGGPFTSIGGQTRNRIARLDPTTGLADSFNPNANGSVAQIVVQEDGKILVGGLFFLIGGQSHTYITRLNPDGGADQTLSLNIVGRPSGIPPPGNGPLASNPSVFATAVQPDGKILFGGKFTSVLSVTRNNIARLNTDNTLDTTFDPSANNTVNAIAVQSDGKILIGGIFTTLSPNGGGSVTRNRIARLNPDATLDTAFNPSANGQVDAIAVQSDGRIFIGGLFNGPNSIGGQMHNYIARLDANGMADSLFNPNANGEVDTIATQPDGKIVVGGQFSGPNSIGGQMRNYIARLNTDGMADSLFNPNANGEVDSIATQPDGKIVVGGRFSGANSIGGQMRNYIARLNPDGMADSLFDPNANGHVFSIAVQADGKILAGGLFTSIHLQTHNYIARLDATTGSPDSFDPHSDGEVDSIATQPDGKVLVGGQFSSIGDEARNAFARLSNDIAALQSLAITRTTVTWTRDGSSPQLTRVTFEYSTDNMAYTLLGNGTAAGNTWTLTGLNLSTGQNIYIRARGYYSGGLHNGSESITEFVQDAFITVRISGTVSYCSNPSLNPVANVTLTLTGDTGRSILSDSLGNYSFAFLTSGGSYTVTPSKTALTQGSAGINTVDVIAVQRHLLNQVLLTGCRLMAADVDQNGGVNTVDVIAIQRFALDLTTGIANVGKYKFTPASHAYPGIASDQTGQNYDTLIFGDVASPFADRAGGP